MNYKTILFFSFLLLVSLQSCNSNQGTMVDYMQLKMKQIGESKVAFLNDEKYTGQANYSLSTGVLQFKYTYKDGLQHESGPLKYWYTWDNEKKTGDWKSFYKSGGKWTLRQFKNDKLHGKLYVWDEETGRLGKEQTYVNGVQTEKINHFEDF